MPRKRDLFDPASTSPYRISRAGLELFHNCPRCFYLDRRLGLPRPGSLPFNLNLAVDALLKKEFDACRRERKPHPLMQQAGIDAVPFSHPELDAWRDNFKGVQVVHGPSNLLVTGAVDDLWETPAGELIVADYKATAKHGEITALNEEWHGSYKPQIEIYQWLLRRKGFTVSPTAYWVYANGDAAAERFDQTLRFRMTVIPYVGSDAWVEGHVMAAKACLMQPAPPPAAADCEHCGFAASRCAHTI
jgi:hypothetical protein